MQMEGCKVGSTKGAFEVSRQPVDIHKFSGAVAILLGTLQAPRGIDKPQGEWAAMQHVGRPEAELLTRAPLYLSTAKIQLGAWFMSLREIKQMPCITRT